MIRFILNNEEIETDLPSGMTVLDFVRVKRKLKGTKIGCREGDCGACTVLVGTVSDDRVRYRSMTSCLMPLANAHGKHVVTVEGINPVDGSMTPVQEALVAHSGTQCGFCTVGFVMSLTGYCLDSEVRSPTAALASVDGNICRCTGYKSIERASIELAELGANGDSISKGVVPGYFASIHKRLSEISGSEAKSQSSEAGALVGGGTDLYVQRPDEMAETRNRNLFDDPTLKHISNAGDEILVGSATVVTDLLESELLRGLFPNLDEDLRLVSSTPIRNMATVAGNLANASPIGDLTIWFLALDSFLVFSSGRRLPLRDFYLGYKNIDLRESEAIHAVGFKKPGNGFRFSFEKVCKRQFLDIASVNTAISLSEVDGRLEAVRLSAGGVSPVPLYLRETSEFLEGKAVACEVVMQALEIMDSEISPIDDVRGSSAYKRLLLRRLVIAHFLEIFKDRVELVDELGGMV
ncbi:MAG: FAD binding domain-containing protein [Pyrinomonadaceae bacterium]